AGAWRGKPPWECTRVTRNSLSVSASTRAPASSGWTIATTIFIGRRLYPASLAGSDSQLRLVISGDAVGGTSVDHSLTLRHAASVARPGGQEADRPGAGCPRPPFPPGGPRRPPRTGTVRTPPGAGIPRALARRTRGRPRGNGPGAPSRSARRAARASPRPGHR